MEEDAFGSLASSSTSGPSLSFPVLEHSDLNRVAEVSSKTEQRCCFWRLREVDKRAKRLTAVDHHPSLQSEYVLKSDSGKKSAERLASRPAEQRGMGAHLGTRQSRSKSIEVKR